MPKILFISDSNVFEPINGGSICIDRHVTRLLADGWEVDWLIPLKFAEVARNRHPEARILHPPERAWRIFNRLFATNQSLTPARIRAKYCLMRLLSRLQRNQYDSLLTLLNGDFTLLASEASWRLGVPLSVIVYDEREVRASVQGCTESLYQETRILFEQASRVWFITPEIRHRYASMGCHVEDDKARDLWPIPGAYALQQREHRPSDSARPTYVYAGDIHKGQDAIIRSLAKLLQSRDGNVLMLCPPRRLSFFTEDIEQGLPIITAEKATPEKAFHYIADRASVILVCYAPANEQPMALGSFPSKILEYAFLSLPILIIAPEEAAVYRWAAKRQWPCLLSCGDETGLERVLDVLATQEGWNAAARASREFALSECDPSHIHKQFVGQIPLR
jgi:hypothetical protein